MTNVFSSVILNFLMILISFLSRLIFIRYFGEYYLGINGVFANLLGILSLADLGMSTALMYSLYKPLADNDEEKIAALIHFFRRIFTGVAIVITVVGLTLLPFLQYVINMEVEIPYIEIYYIIALLTTASSYLFVYKSLLIKADQKGYIVNKIQGIYGIISFAIQVVIIVGLQSYMAYVIALLILSVLGNVIINITANKMYPYLKKRHTKLEERERKVIGKNFKSLFIYKFCITLQTYTDNLMISIFVGTLVVGYYSNYTLVLGAMTTLLILVFDNIKSSVGNLIVSNADEENHFRYFKVLDFFNFWAVGFLSVAFLVCLTDFIELVFGEHYVLSFGVLFLIMLNFYKTNIRQAVWVIRETTGLFNKTKYISLVSSILNMILSLVLGYYMGLSGIILGTILAHFLYAWWREPFIIFGQYFKVSPGIYFRSYLVRMLIIGLAFIATYFLCTFVTIENLYLNFGSKVVISAIVPNLVILLFSYKTEEFQYLKRLIKRTDG